MSSVGCVGFLLSWSENVFLVFYVLDGGDIGRTGPCSVGFFPTSICRFLLSDLRCFSHRGIPEHSFDYRLDLPDDLDSLTPSSLASWTDALCRGSSFFLLLTSVQSMPKSTYTVLCLHFASWSPDSLPSFCPFWESRQGSDIRRSQSALNPPPSGVLLAPSRVTSRESGVQAFPSGANGAPLSPRPWWAQGADHPPGTPLVGRRQCCSAGLPTHPLPTLPLAAAVSVAS